MQSLEKILNYHHLQYVFMNIIGKHVIIRVADTMARNTVLF